MSMHAKFINFICPIEIIRSKYPGGIDRFIKDYERDFGVPPNYDEDLFMACAMNPMDIENLVNYWIEKGFQCTKQVNGELRWHEVCVFEELFGGPTLPCDWIGFNEQDHSVYLKSPKNRGEGDAPKDRGPSDWDAFDADDELQAIIRAGKYKSPR